MPCPASSHPGLRCGGDIRRLSNLTVVHVSPHRGNKSVVRTAEFYPAETGTLTSHIKGPAYWCVTNGVSALLLRYALTIEKG